MYWVFIFLVVTMLLPESQASEKNDIFKVSHLNVSEKIDAKIIPGFLMEQNRANLIVTQIKKDHQRFLKIYSMNIEGYYNDGTFSDIQITDDVIFMDIGRVQNTELDNIILFKRDAAWWIDPISGEQHKLMKIQSVYQNVIKNELPHFDVVKDVNGDALDDILLPTFNGYQLFVQITPGVFSDPIEVGPAPLMKTTDEYAAIMYKHSKANVIDINFDDKDDLVFWDAPNLKVFEQKTQGSFATENQILPLGIELEDIEEMAIRMGGEDQSDISSRTFHKMSDINSDKSPDLITQTVTSEGVFSKRTTIEFFMGHQSDNNKLMFSDKPDTQIHSTGIQITPEEKDFNNDGKTDIIIASVDFGLSMILKALITGSVTIDLNFYQQSLTGFPNKPNITREMKIKFDLSSGELNAPILLIEDVNGDQLLDLLVSDEDSLQISYGDRSQYLFSTTQHQFDIPVPSSPDLVETFDLNADGKMDAILRYKTIDQNSPHEIKVLLAN